MRTDTDAPPIALACNVASTCASDVDKRKRHKTGAFTYTVWGVSRPREIGDVMHALLYLMRVATLVAVYNSH